MSFSEKNAENSMFYGASSYLFKYAKELRDTPTKAESLLWEKLKRKQLGFKFRRQHPVYKYIADFYCHELKLIIEVDGDYHNQKDQKEYDTFRTEDISDLNVTVIRFSNNQVLNDLNNVIDTIKRQIDSLMANAVS